MSRCKECKEKVDRTDRNSIIVRQGKKYWHGACWNSGLDVSEVRESMDSYQQRLQELTKEIEQLKKDNEEIMNGNRSLIAEKELIATTYREEIKELKKKNKELSKMVKDYIALQE